MERKFASTYAETRSTVYSAAKAGYARPTVQGAETLAKAGVQEEIRRRLVQRLHEEAAPLAVATLCQIMGDERQPAGARVQASKIALDFTLRDTEQGASVSPHEMTPEQLARAINHGKLKVAAFEHVAADRAKPVIDHAEPGILD